MALFLEFTSFFRIMWELTAFPVFFFLVLSNLSPSHPRIFLASFFLCAEFYYFCAFWRILPFFGELFAWLLCFFPLFWWSNPVSLSPHFTFFAAELVLRLPTFVLVEYFDCVRCFYLRNLCHCTRYFVLFSCLTVRRFREFLNCPQHVRFLFLKPRGGTCGPWRHEETPA